MTDAVLLYTTAPDAATAQRIARALIEARLTACANIIPGMQSVYRWRDGIETDEEVVAIFKTSAAAAEAARKRIVELHPYATPCVLALATAGPGSNPDFLAWIGDETRR